MTSDAFNQLLGAYRQQTIEMNVSSITPGSEEATLTWVQLLQRHVQEWKQHYRLESQAVEQVRENYRHIRRQVGSLSILDQSAILAAESQESKEVSMSFQAKRDLIWARHQQELNISRFVV
ncbi:hypothetical protein [Spirosoma radiotolerans]|nr:hypothetical protein [Spirosoma radiotolerans]